MNSSVGRYISPKGKIVKESPVMNGNMKKRKRRRNAGLSSRDVGRPTDVDW